MRHSILQSWLDLMQADLLSGIGSAVDLSGQLPPLPYLPPQDPSVDGENLRKDFQKVAQDFRHVFEGEIKKL